MACLLTAGVGALGAAPVGPRSVTGAQVDGSEIVPLSPLHTEAGRIRDAAGRDVLLRGANLNSLGGYWQGGTWPATFGVDESVWAEMKSWGFSAVRLIVTWDRIEPSPGVYDEAYLDRVDEQIRMAAKHGIYTVLDMHQDAYSSQIFWDGTEICPAGTQPAKGWDGAPSWAVFTDGLSTCTTGERNATPAVRRAWQNFYRNRDGIADRFVAMWAHVAARFVDRSEIAGFDLLNEPETAGPSAEMGPLYNQLMADTIAAIRLAESSSAFEHLLFIEPAIPAGNPDDGLVIPDPVGFGVDTRNVVAAPHNYAESIGLPGLDVTVEQMNALFASIADGLGIPVWVGEYGYWSTSAENLDAARRQAADDDLRGWGGAWWQWFQSCGDPHAVYWDSDAQRFSARMDGSDTQLHDIDCTTNTVGGPTDEFKRIAGRSFYRAAPGTVSELFNDLDAETARLVGATEAGFTGTGAAREVVMWVPNRADGTQASVTFENLVNRRTIEVDGGRILLATVDVAGCYALHVGEAMDSCPDAPPPLVPVVPAVPEPVKPAYVG